MIVDDESAITELYCRWLEQSGYEVRGFTDPVVALRAFRNEQLDLLISDFNMPRLNGSEFGRAIRSIKPEVPIIFATGDPRIAKDLTVANGCVLEKPFKLSTLTNAIDGLVASAKARREVSGRCRVTRGRE